ncbi:hypothetical protein D1007_09706 [Hordeum vulgare]|nr:hypothetical protein D1007_09706 [Hordeum vulgare]
MARDKTRELEQKKKGKRTRKGLYSFAAPPPGSIHGYWLPSTSMEEMVLNLNPDGVVPEKGWRLPGADELEPVSHQDERVLLVSHIER